MHVCCASIKLSWQGYKTPVIRESHPFIFILWTIGIYYEFKDTKKDRYKKWNIDFFWKLLQRKIFIKLQQNKR